MPSDVELENMKAEYSHWLSKYGDDQRSVGWNRPKQSKRFAGIAEPIDTLLSSPGCKVVDVGCGLGHLKSYLQSQGYECEYHGIDINEELIAAARDSRGHGFSVGTNVPTEEAPDIIVACGFFNRKFADSKLFFLECMKGWIRTAKSTVAVSALSACAREKQASNHYISLSDVEAVIDRQYVEGFRVDGESLPGELIIHLHLTDRS